VFRVAQGLTAALLFPQVASFIQVLFPPAERPRAFGLQGAVTGLGIIAGPLLGGLIIGADLLGTSWRPMFLVNLPIGLLALWWGVRALPESRSVQAKRLDLPGVLLLTLALVALIYPITEGRERGWPTWMLALAVLSAGLLWAFVTYQRRLLRQGKTPLVELSMFADRSFAVGALIAFVFQSSVLSYFVVMSLFFQSGLGYQPVQAALLLISYQVAIALASLLSARLGARLGRSLLTLGTLLLMAGLAGTLMILRSEALHYQGYELIPALLVGGIGFGCVVAPLQTIILSRIVPVYAGSASGVLATVQQVGSALGVAVIGILLFGQLGAGAREAALQARPALAQTLTALDLPLPAVQSLTQGFEQCVYTRFNQPDLNQVPAPCVPAAGSVAARPEVQAALGAAETEARRQNFLSATLVTLRFQLLAYGICFLLVFLLPQKNRA
jgi:MFS family permease